jgi:hypothetical protein
MKRMTAMGNKFKRLEMAIRKTMLSYANTYDELNKLMSSPQRPEKEVEWLASIKKELTELHKQTAVIAQKVVSYED